MLLRESDPDRWVTDWFEPCQRYEHRIGSGCPDIAGSFTMGACLDRDLPDLVRANCQRHGLPILNRHSSGTRSHAGPGSGPGRSLTDQPHDFADRLGPGGTPGAMEGDLSGRASSGRQTNTASSTALDGASESGALFALKSAAGVTMSWRLGPRNCQLCRESPVPAMR